MATAYSDYLFTPVAGVMTPWVNVWVRLVSNVTGTAYISDAATDPKGRFTFAVKPPADSYTTYTGPTGSGAWTGTGNVAYAVPLVANDSSTGNIAIGGANPWIDVKAPSVTVGATTYILGAKGDG